MKKAIVVALLFVIAGGCSFGFSFHIGSPPTKGPSLAERNRANLNRLEVGICRSRVIELMGQPYKTEAFGDMEYLLYLTGEDACGEAAYTRIALREGKVIGWGKHCPYPKQE